MTCVCPAAQPLGTRAAAAEPVGPVLPPKMEKVGFGPPPTPGGCSIRKAEVLAGCRGCHGGCELRHGQRQHGENPFQLCLVPGTGGSNHAGTHVESNPTLRDVYKHTDKYYAIYIQEIYRDAVSPCALCAIPREPPRRCPVPWGRPGGHSCLKTCVGK